jgi:hypothetical protein
MDHDQLMWRFVFGAGLLMSVAVVWFVSRALMMPSTANVIEAVIAAAATTAAWGGVRRWWNCT